MCFAFKWGIRMSLLMWNFHRLIPMERTSLFFVRQWLGKVSKWAKHNSQNIIICLNTIYYEPFELWHMNSICFHELHKGPPHKNLRVHILQLHVTYYNCHDPGLVWVIDMACHGAPTRNMFTMVKHQPCSLQIST